MPAPFLALAVGGVVAVGVLAACQKVLSEARMRPLSTLAGTEWGMADGERFVAFKTGGEVVGSGGCNSFFGTFDQDGDAVTFGPLASTRKACPPDVMDAERDWLDLLGRTRRVDATAMELVLFGSADEELARLRRRDRD